MKKKQKGTQYYFCRVYYNNGDVSPEYRFSSASLRNKAAKGFEKKPEVSSVDRYQRIN